MAVETSSPGVSVELGDSDEGATGPAVEASTVTDGAEVSDTEATEVSSAVVVSSTSVVVLGVCEDEVGSSVTDGSGPSVEDPTVETLGSVTAGSVDDSTG